MRLCRRRPVVKNSCPANYRCMTHDIYIVKTRTNKHKQTDSLLYVNDGCGLNNCYSMKCKKQQEKVLFFKAWITDRIGSRIGSQKIQRNQIVYDLVINKQ